MKKPAWFDTPARLLIATSALILAGEFLIMRLIENLPATLLANILPGNLVFELLDPVLLTLLVAPALYVLIFGPMRRQQAELDAARKTIEQSHQEWMEALDVLDDPIFLYDREFRILRCNKAYQQHAGIPFKQIIGRPYYEIFPRSGAPDCLRTKALVEDKGEEEVTVGEVTYRSRVFSIRDEQQACLYSVHTLTDITGRKETESQLTRQIEELRAWHDVTLGRELRILELKREVDELLGEAGRPPRYPSTEDGLKEN